MRDIIRTNLTIGRYRSIGELIEQLPAEQWGMILKLRSRSLAPKIRRPAKNIILRDRVLISQYFGVELDRVLDL